MKTIGAFLVLALLGTAAAQGPTRINLNDAIDLAMTHNPALKATRTQVPQSQAQASAQR